MSVLILDKLAILMGSTLVFCLLNSLREYHSSSMN